MKQINCVTSTCLMWQHWIFNSSAKYAETSTGQNTSYIEFLLWNS